MEDERIIDLYFARNEAAIKETEMKYGRLLFSIARNVLDLSEDAEECVNDTYLALWNAIPPAKPARFFAFAAKIVRNLSLKKFRYLHEEKRNAGILQSFDELAEMLPDERMRTDAEEGEIARAISMFLRTEKKESRQVFLRKYYFFDSVKDIAECFGFSESKVKNMLLHTRKRLRTYLEKEGIIV